MCTERSKLRTDHEEAAVLERESALLPENCTVIVIIAQSGWILNIYTAGVLAFLSGFLCNTNSKTPEPIEGVSHIGSGILLIRDVISFTL